jgi:hypothetical protein
MKIKPCRATPLLYQLSNASIVTFSLIFRERLHCLLATEVFLMNSLVRKIFLFVELGIAFFGCVCYNPVP